MSLIHKIFRNTFRTIFLIANTIVGIGFLACAYSPSVSPADHPIWACAGLFIPIFIFLNLCFIIFWLIVNCKFVILPILFFILGWSSLSAYWPVNIFGESSDGGPQIKLLTYNVMAMRGNISEYLLESEADIVCLQEYPYTDKKLRARLQKKYPYIKTYNFHGINAVACLSKYPITKVSNIELESAYNGSVQFNVRYSKDITIPLIVNHLESNKLDSHDKAVYKDMLKSPDEAKVKSGSKYLLRKLADAVSIRGPQADAVAARIKEIDSPYIIVCGDFNDTPVSYVHNTIAEGLQDAYIQSASGPGITYNRNFLYFRIDHILAGTSYKVIDCNVDRSIDESDHYPMYATLEIVKK